eukprot:1865065-Rhodomonas_salina.1
MFAGIGPFAVPAAKMHKCRLRAADASASASTDSAAWSYQGLRCSTNLWVWWYDLRQSGTVQSRAVVAPSTAVVS